MGTLEKPESFTGLLQYYQPTSADNSAANIARANNPTTPRPAIPSTGALSDGGA